MARVARWEYARITHDESKATMEVEYSAHHKVEKERPPSGSLVFTLGELGEKGWELVSVTASWRGEGAYVTVLYFKRPHADRRELRE